MSPLRRTQKVRSTSERGEGFPAIVACLGKKFYLQNERRATVATSAHAIEMRKIRKVYGGDIVANDGIDFDVRFGEVHCLLGENGAGKSTLMKILFGLVQPDEGEILINGSKVKLHSPSDALNAGIGMVHQQFKLVSSLTVLENVALALNVKHLTKIETQFDRICIQYDLKLDKKKRVIDLPAHEQQLVEILKLLCLGQKILVFDEPTSILVGEQIAKLLARFKNWAQMGHAVVFISHKMNEVLDVGNRISVLRNGKKVACVEGHGMNRDELIKLMVGEDYKEYRRSKIRDLSSSHRALEIDNVSVKNAEEEHILDGVSFSVREGEIYGIAGIQGNGQDTLVEVITGTNPETVRITSGKVIFEGRDITSLNSNQIQNLNIDVGYIPPKAKDIGVASTLSVKENLLLRSWEEFGRFFVKWRMVDKRADELIEKYYISVPSKEAKISTLSGGNKIKIILARELSRKTRVLVIFDPCPGLDVKSIEFFKKNLLEISSKERRAILLVSSDLDLLFEICDRLGVIFRGRIYPYESSNGEFRLDEITNMMTAGGGK